MARSSRALACFWVTACLAFAEEQPQQEDYRCLFWQGDGCESIKKELLCVHSRDGNYHDVFNTNVAGGPCVWHQSGECKRLDQVSHVPAGEYKVAACASGETLEGTITKVKPPAREPTRFVEGPGLDGDAHMPWNAVELAPLDGGKGRVCRGVMQTQTGERSHAYNAWTAESLEQCKGLCTASCQGIEYKHSSMYCEVWYAPILFSAGHVFGTDAPATDYECYNKPNEDLEGQLNLLRPADTSCLASVPKGCSSIKDRFYCLSSKDGSGVQEDHGLQIDGQPCVWCGGGLCHSGGDSMCEPFDFLLRGAGKDFAFNSFHAIGVFEVSGCQGDRPKIAIPPAADWRPEPPTAAQLALLTPAPGGCSSIRDMGTCLISKDAGPVTTEKVYRVKGEACVWCGGSLCTTKDDSLCMPFDLVMNGEGSAFTSFHAKGSFKVASMTPSKISLPSGWDGSCLSAVNAGCPSFKDDKYSCLSSTDGRPEDVIQGRKVHGQPCVWCNGGMCNNNGNRCEAFDVQMNGEGNVYAKNYAGSNTKVARCVNGLVDPQFDIALTPPPFPVERPIDAQCLKAEPRGCFAVRDKLTCLSSYDASTTKDFGGLKIQGEPCVWCGGGICHSGGDSLCAPFGYLEKGAGRAFETLNGVVLTAAKCWSSDGDFGDLSCLAAADSGCNKLSTYEQCTSSKDGRSFQQVAGFKVAGQPCVWCGGGSCNSGSSNKCEPYDFAVNGEGHAFERRNHLGVFHRAGCEGTKSVAIALPTLDEINGALMSVECGYPRPLWKVSKTCGFCQVLLSATAMGDHKTCASYCGAQGGNLGCSKAYTAGSFPSCDLGEERSCAYTFGPTESAICKCGIPLNIRDEPWKKPRPVAEEMTCLISQPKGCSAITDRTNCLSSTDGRPDATSPEGLKIGGEPCVWCGGIACTSVSDAKCEPYDWLMNGEGIAFGTVHAKSAIYQVARCHHNEDAVFDDLQCLQPHVSGCNSIQDWKTCLSSVDGRSYEYVAGFKAAGQPCVWCGGGACHTNNLNKCEPYDFAINGQGHAFNTFHSQGTFQVASCQDGKPAGHILNSGFGTHGTSLAVDCGDPKPVWLKVARLCGKCQVMVPRIDEFYNTCHGYCAAQPGSPKCTAASMTQRHSCDVASVKTCDYQFAHDDAALCTCAEVQLFQETYAQCGGKDWKGLTLCKAGAYCKAVNEYFSQCLPFGGDSKDLGGAAGGDDETLGSGPDEALGSGPLDLIKADTDASMSGPLGPIQPGLDLDCLKPIENGCGSTKSRITCLSSKDGREGYTAHGLRVGGEACVWCGGGLCTSYNDHMCAPYDWLNRGEGKAFKILHARSNHQVAQCQHNKDAIFDNLQCLKKQQSGCNSIKDQTTCLASVDDRPYDRIAGLQVSGQPCVWCGGITCNSNNNNMCEPYDYAINGQGHAYSTFNAKLIYTVAGCEGGHAVSHIVSDAIASRGLTVEINCGNPRLTWSGLSKLCGQCRVLVPHMEHNYKTCRNYCAEQNGNNGLKGIGCRSAHLAYSYSCDVQKDVTCDYIFDFGESGVCNCDPDTKASKSVEKSLGSVETPVVVQTPLQKVEEAAHAAEKNSDAPGTDAQYAAIGNAAGKEAAQVGVMPQKAADIAAKHAAESAKAAGHTPQEQVGAAALAAAEAAKACGVTFQQQMSSAATAGGKQAAISGMSPQEAADYMSDWVKQQASAANEPTQEQIGMLVDVAATAARAAAVQAGMSAEEVEQAASAAAAKVAAKYNPSSEAVTTIAPPVDNIGADCWEPCDKKSGFCSFCGSGNACCRKDHADQPLECKGVTSFTTWHHECVIPSTPEQAGKAAAEDAKSAGKSPEEQVTAAAIAAEERAASVGWTPDQQAEAGAKAAGAAAAGAGLTGQQAAAVAAAHAASVAKAKGKTPREQVEAAASAAGKAAAAAGTSQKDEAMSIGNAAGKESNAVSAGSLAGIEPAEAADVAYATATSASLPPPERVRAAAAAAQEAAALKGLTPAEQADAAAKAAGAAAFKSGVMPQQTANIAAEEATQAAKDAGKSQEEQVRAAAEAASKTAAVSALTESQQQSAAMTAARNAAAAIGMSQEQADAIVKQMFAPPALEPLKNIGKDCWVPCEEKSGYCDFCGQGNACCRQDQSEDAPSECRNIQSFTTWHHECVVPASVVQSREIAPPVAPASPSLSQEIAPPVTPASPPSSQETPAEAAVAAETAAKENGQTGMQAIAAAADAAANTADQQGMTAGQQAAAAAAAIGASAAAAGVGAEQASGVAAAGAKLAVQNAGKSLEDQANAAVTAAAEAAAQFAKTAGKTPEEQVRAAAAEAKQVAASTPGLLPDQQKAAVTTAVEKVAAAAGISKEQADAIVNEEFSPSPAAAVPSVTSAAEAGAAAAAAAAAAGETPNQQVMAAAQAAHAAAAAAGKSKQEQEAETRAAAMAAAQAAGLTGGEAEQVVHAATASVNGELVAAGSSVTLEPVEEIEAKAEGAGDKELTIDTSADDGAEAMDAKEEGSTDSALVAAAAPEGGGFGPWQWGMVGGAAAAILAGGCAAYYLSGQRSKPKKDADKSTKRGADVDPNRSLSAEDLELQKPLVGPTANLFDAIDTNHDGILDRNEWARAQTITSSSAARSIRSPAANAANLFNAIDSNNNGMLDRNEWARAQAIAQGLAPTLLPGPPAVTFTSSVAAPVASLPAVCHACGNVFAPDANFCRKCGAQRR
eukprot:TRINITY_DN1743_c0_g1_i1.p1 TRINITY_DN1743_c0_g1~~TRINITY_DN1743_c0_g1_i1.p1  ORF type:complete len:2698 (+),score=678.60 TRINITY_DN1743_c0_g1_i1:54-8147(+)